MISRRELIAGAGLAGIASMTLGRTGPAAESATPSDVDVVGGSMSVASDGRLSGFARGSIDIGASSLSGSVDGSASGLVGGDGSLTAGGSLSVEGASGSATFGAGVTVSASAMSMESSGEVRGVASTVDVSGSERVRRANRRRQVSVREPNCCSSDSADG